MFRSRFSKTAVSMLAATLLGVLTVGGCSDDDDNGGGGGGASFGTTLTINAQVYELLDRSGNENYVLFDGDREVVAGYYREIYDEDFGYWHSEFVPISSGRGGITNGRFNFTVGTPPNLTNITDDFVDPEEQYDNIHISNPNARSANVSFNVSNATFQRGRTAITRNTDTQRAAVEEYVGYVYVDRDVTLSGTGRTIIEDDYADSRTYITRNFSLNLKNGWNAMHLKMEIAGTYNAIKGAWDYTYTQSISLNDPSNIRWVLWEDDNDYYYKRQVNNDWLNTIRRPNIFRGMRDNAE